MSLSYAVGISLLHTSEGTDIFLMNIIISLHLSAIHWPDSNDGF